MEARCQDNGVWTRPAGPPSPHVDQSQGGAAPAPQKHRMRMARALTSGRTAGHAASRGLPQAHRLSIPTSTHCTSFRSGADTSGGFSFPPSANSRRGASVSPSFPQNLLHPPFEIWLLHTTSRCGFLFFSFLFVCLSVSFLHFFFQAGSNFSMPSLEQVAHPSFLPSPLKAHPFTEAFGRTFEFFVACRVTRLLGRLHGGRKQPLPPAPGEKHSGFPCAVSEKFGDGERRYKPEGWGVPLH